MASSPQLAERMPMPGAWERMMAARAVEIERQEAALWAMADSALTIEMLERESELQLLLPGGETALPEKKLRADTRARLDVLRKLRAAHKLSSDGSGRGDGAEEFRAVARLRQNLRIARRQLAVRDAPDGLRAWASENSLASEWAYQRLRALDPAAADEFLEERLRNYPRHDEALCEFLTELIKTAPARAAATLAALPAERRAFLDLRDEEEGEPLGAASPDELLRIIQDAARPLGRRLAALSRLVPAEMPRRYPSEEVDRILAETLRGEAQPADPPGDRMLRGLATALSLRDGGRHWEVIVEAMSKMDSESDGGAWVLRELIPAVYADPPKFRPRIAALLRPRLETTHGQREGLLWVAFLSDARELRGLIAALATSGPEQRGADDPTPSSDPGPIEHRSHLARQIASIWDEPDAATRLNLLAAIAIRAPRVFAGLYPAASTFLAQQLRHNLALVAPGELASLRRIVDELVEAEREDGRNEEEQISEVRRIIGEALDAPSSSGP